MSEREPWSFCEKEENKCTMNMCDEYGCQERKRVLVEPSHLYVVKHTEEETCEGCSDNFPIESMRMDDEDGNWWCNKCISEFKTEQQ